ncbi:MAG: hypothetical protein WD887_00465 [Candidatus Saccharimonadales bacterium]
MIATEVKGDAQMTKITLHKEPDGWRSCIEQNDKIVVLDNIFDSQEDAITEARAVISRM